MAFVEVKSGSIAGSSRTSAPRSRRPARGGRQMGSVDPVLAVPERIPSGRSLAVSALRRKDNGRRLGSSLGLLWTTQRCMLPGIWNNFTWFNIFELILL